MKSVGVIAANGYTGSELIRILALHPKVELACLFSRSNSGIRISEIYPDLEGICDIELTNVFHQVDVLFLCLPHQESRRWLVDNIIDDQTLIIDLGNDFRVEGDFLNRNFVYGLPEFNKKLIETANSIANPGCFATAIQLALLPLAKNNLLDEVYTTGITGATGAGQKLQSTTQFTWRNDNISAYKTLTHQHVEEILMTLRQLNNKTTYLQFVPWRGDFARGIFTSSTIKCDMSWEEVTDLYTSFYHEAEFVTISNQVVDMKRVINTNRCVLQIEKNKDFVVIHSAIDNLIKGAAGQAVQNMNIALQWEENLGLRLKPLAF